MSHRTYSDTADSAAERRREWAGFLIPPIAWAVYFVIVYLADEFSCMLTDISLMVAGRSLTYLLSLAATVVTIAVIAYAGRLGYRTWQDADVGNVPNWQRDQEADRRHFMGVSGMLLSGLFLILTFGVAAAVLFLDSC